MKLACFSTILVGLFLDLLFHLLCGLEILHEQIIKGCWGAPGHNGHKTYVFGAHKWGLNISFGPKISNIKVVRCLENGTHYPPVQNQSEYMCGSSGRSRTINCR